MPARLADWLVAHRLAASAGELRHAFDHVVAPRRTTWDPVLAGHAWLLEEVGPIEAVRCGVPLTVAIETAVHLTLLNSIEDSVRLPVRDEMLARSGPPRCLAWYGQHEVWPAVLDIARQVQLIRPSPAQAAHLALWTALGRSCGWWWPLDDICVVAERPLHLLGTARYPGNPDCHLHLYQVPGSVWGTAVRLLVATNGSVERDGTRRTYGLTVPAHIDHPLTAAAWTYGLPAYVYARLARRT